MKIYTRGLRYEINYNNNCNLFVKYLCLAITCILRKEVKTMTEFDKLNKDTFNYNNGITRNTSPTDGCHKMKASDLLANFNNYTYKTDNGCYPDRLY